MILVFPTSERLGAAWREVRLCDRLREGDPEREGALPVLPVAPEAAGGTGVVFLLELESEPPQAPRASAERVSRIKLLAGIVLDDTAPETAIRRLVESSSAPVPRQRVRQLTCGRIMKRAFALFLLLAGVVLVAGCGGGDSEKKKSPAGTTSQPGTGATQPGTGATAATGPTGKRPSTKGTRPSTPKKATTPRRPSKSTGGFAGRQGDVYVIAKEGCRKTALRTLAVLYGITTRRPRLIARAYTQRINRPALRRAAFEGCLVGLKAQSK